MQLTRHTDYALRVLLHLAVVPTGRATIPEISEAYGLSRNHLMKVVHGLALGGFLDTQRGRGGGFTLAKLPTEIRIGAVVRHSEPDMKMADCSNCAIRPACGLSGVLAEATNAFLAVLDRYSLADAARDRGRLAALIAALPAPATGLSETCAPSGRHSD
ncbi:Rrf2 family transcriptional regulator [Sphingobium sp.]|uniref:Rrf2 family transcriptional regulator n=1 Tax=Sphingobium sp. TaxID=1912891 RepID=UPI002B63A2B8|nr:Rrf2 family transcriptional regulator [Sphingobium sp.]HUD92771.1 Rrf2 family transcriptional regulator [Sphingobium sp.]